MAFDLSTAKPISRGGFDLSTAKPIADQAAQGAFQPIPSQQAAQKPREPIKPGRSAKAQRIRAKKQEAQNLLEAFESGQVTSKDMTPDQVEKVRAARIEAIPELTGNIKKLSKDLGLVDALAGMVTFDPDEFGRILTKSDPNIGVVTTPEGERIAINQKTGEGFSINKIGPTLMDAVQVGGAIASFTPSGVLPTVGKQIAGAVATQTAIEKTQERLGGEFDPGEILLAGAGVPVAAGAAKIAKAATKGLKGIFKGNTSLIDQKTGLPTTKFSKALEKRGMDFGGLTDDMDLLPSVSGKTPDQVADDILRAKIKAGSGDKALYQYRLDRAGNIKTDKLGVEAVKQGVREGDVASMKAANPQTRRLMLKMLNMKRAIQSDESKVLKFRPSDVMGDEVMSRFTFIKDQAAKLRGQLDDLAERPFIPKAIETGKGSGGLKGLKIDKQRVQNAYLDSLGDLRVKVDSSKIPPELDFSQSLISEDKTSQNVIKRLTRILAKGDEVDASEAHLIKRQIDTMLDFSKKSPAGLTDAGKKFAKKIRSEINESIRDVSPQYAEINDNLSASITALNDFDSAIGTATRLGDPGAEKAVGTILKRLLGNPTSRTNISNALASIERQAKDMGGAFDTQLDKMIIFNQTLEDSFGATARGSLKGDIESTLIGGVKGAVIKKAAEKVDKIYGVSDKKRFDAIHKILKRGNN